VNVLCTTLASACRPGAAYRDPVILSLGDHEVRRSDFERHLAGLEAQGGGPLTPEVREAVLLPWLEEQVQVLEAQNRGLLERGASAEEERKAIQALLFPLQGPAVSDDEIAAYYQDHGEEFQVPETVTLQQILLPNSNEARDVRRRLTRDPRSFEALARERSKGPEASKGGLMGRFARGELPSELEAAAFALAPGKLSDIVETSLGFHVLKVEAREPAREETLPEASARIRASLEGQKADQKVREFVSDLMTKAKVNHAAALSPSRS
jgi:parvulin-like peptidyl-prolyl isomerase